MFPATDDRETHLSPDKITFLPDERIQCDRTKYEDNYTPLYIVKVTVGAEFHIYESTLDITEVLSRFPAVWYNVTDIMPHDDFRPDLQFAALHQLAVALVQLVQLASVSALDCVSVYYGLLKHATAHLPNRLGN
ncbi:unnamed protein product [Dibothriocephalus latus]|uniref:Uncharacterized protein n=1 Tax=Dibothriocephalus latus TaxID=60516 RepID=A0A3P7LFR5_DIBLA|nr:unnamed protein product [Dibothriocephalus latus]